MAFTRITVPKQAEPKQNPLVTGANVLGGLGARAVEEAVGLPGSLQQGAKSLGSLARQGIEAFTGPLPELPLPQSPLLAGIKKLVGPDYAPYIPDNPLDINLPTTETVRKGTQALTGQHLEPKNELERNAQEFVSTAVPLLLSGATHPLKIAGAGQFSKWASGFLPISELGREGIKTGTMLAASFLGQPKIKEFAGGLYNAVEDKLSKVAPIAAKDIDHHISGLLNKLEKVHFNKKSDVEGILKSIGKSINEGTNTIDPLQLYEIRKHTNDFLRKTRGSPGAQKYLSEISEYLKSNIMASAPEIGKELNLADNLYRSLKTSEVGAKTLAGVMKQVSGKLAPFTFTALSYFLPVSGPIKKAIGLGGLTLHGIKSGYNFFNKMKNNPGLQHFYKKIITSAAQENSVQLVKDIRLFDRYLKKHPELQKSLVEPKKSFTRIK